MKRVLKIIYVLLGVIFLITGLVGIVVPLLPTTPFILLASFFLAKGSDRINNYFKKSWIYKNYIVNFKANGLTVKQKIKIVITADLMMLTSGFFINNLHVRIFLFFLAVIKTIIIFRVKTNTGNFVKVNENE